MKFFEFIFGAILRIWKLITTFLYIGLISALIFFLLLVLMPSQMQDAITFITGLGG